MESREKNLKEALFPLRTAYAIIGHGIFRCPAGKQRPVISVIYAVALTSLYFVALCYTLEFAFRQPWFGDHEKILFTVVYVNVAIFIVGIVISWSNARSKVVVKFVASSNQRFALITESLAKIDETLRELGASFDYGKTRTEGYAFIVLWFVVVVSIDWVDVLWLSEVRPVTRVFLVFAVLHYPTHVLTIVVSSFAMDIRQVHLELGDISRDMCKTHGTQVTLNTASLFVTFTGCLYLLYTMLVNPVGLGRDSQMIALSVWILFSFTHFVLLNEVSERVCAEARRTGEIIHCIGREIDDPELAREISQFSLQLILDPLEFRPAELIGLGHRFVLGFAETVSTYLVIIVQMSPSKSGGTASHRAPLSK